MLANFKKNTKERKSDEMAIDENLNRHGLSQQAKNSNRFEEPLSKSNFNFEKYGFNKSEKDQS